MINETELYSVTLSCDFSLLAGCQSHTFIRDERAECLNAAYQKGWRFIGDLVLCIRCEKTIADFAVVSSEMPVKRVAL